MSDDRAHEGKMHASRIAYLEASVRALLRIQDECAQLAAEAGARARRLAEELRLLKASEREQ